MSDKHLRRVAEEWAHGWALSRGVPAPTAEPDGHRIEVGKPGHRVRYVLPGTDSVLHRSTTLTAPGTWLKICGTPADLAPQWIVGEPEYLMSKQITAVELNPPSPYSVDVVGDGVVRDAVVRTTTGEQAARGRVAVWGTAAVVDQVETEATHRRRGLGRVVMAKLEVIAADLGASRAVLVATEDGLGLYRSLGWTVESPVTPAHLPES